jgi:hypothetical protein
MTRVSFTKDMENHPTGIGCKGTGTINAGDVGKFNITIERVAGIAQPQIVLDGKVLDGNLIPLQKPGTKHTVEVRIP